MENIKKRLGNLLTVKSLVTITLTVIFAVLALRETISGSEFLTIFTVVIGFYFGTQRVAGQKQLKPVEKSTVNLKGDIL